MNYAYAVIGANFGDEGKGLTTDYLTRKRKGIVARQNGGAQAGHTVETSDGLRHVFGHIGAGTFAGASTYLSRQFIINPYVLVKEIDQMHALNISVEDKLFANPECRVTLIYDMALNALRELSRGKVRHGSCGLGINETVNRCNANYLITLGEIQRSSIYQIKHKIERIFNEYWKKEFEVLKDRVDFEEAEPFRKMFENPDFEHDAIKLIVLKNLNINFLNTDFDRPNKNLIIEGAQGLMLDEHLGTFPHVTRSITGLPSSILTAHEMFYNNVTPVYVTRCYLTRHGAGPLKMEDKPITNIALAQDKTNVTGPWQGHFRYAPLDVDCLSLMINKDIHRSYNISRMLNVQINKPELMITCLDQVGELLNVNLGGELKTIATENLPNLLSQYLPDLTVRYLSYGPTASSVKDLMM